MPSQWILFCANNRAIWPPVSDTEDPVTEQKAVTGSLLPFCLLWLKTSRNRNSTLIPMIIQPTVVICPHYILVYSAGLMLHPTVNCVYSVFLTLVTSVLDTLFSELLHIQTAMVRLWQQLLLLWSWNVVKSTTIIKWRLVMKIGFHEHCGSTLIEKDIFNSFQ